MRLQTFQDFVTLRNLWLIHIGHSWFIYRVGIEDFDNVDFDAVKMDFPRAVVIQQVRQITTADELRRFADIAKVEKEKLALMLNAAVPESGFDMVLGLRGLSG